MIWWRSLAIPLCNASTSELQYPRDSWQWRSVTKNSYSHASVRKFCPYRNIEKECLEGPQTPFSKCTNARWFFQSPRLASFNNVYLPVILAHLRRVRGVFEPRRFADHLLIVYPRMYTSWISEKDKDWWGWRGNCFTWARFSPFGVRKLSSSMSIGKFQPLPNFQVLPSGASKPVRSTSFQKNKQIIYGLRGAFYCLTEASRGND